MSPVPPPQHPRTLVTAPLRGPGLDKLRKIADVVYDPWIDQSPLRMYDGEKLAERARKEDARVLVVVFTCNHCPTAQAYEDRVIKLATDYKDKGVAVVAIQPNDPRAVRLDELGYTDLSDSFEEMKTRARDKGFQFPYLYDGATQQTSCLLYTSPSPRD